jgi:hypothetical protein
MGNASGDAAPPSMPVGSGIGEGAAPPQAHDGDASTHVKPSPQSASTSQLACHR